MGIGGHRMSEVTHTHWLCCRHCVGEKRSKEYVMRCNILGETRKSIKLEIIGERYWKGYENKKRIRYLPKSEKWRLKQCQK